MNVRASFRLPLNLGGSPRSPVGVCAVGAVVVGGAGFTGVVLHPFRSGAKRVSRMN